MSIYYICSEKFDYSQAICDDQGPAYARRQGWETVSLSDAQSVVTKPHIFDNRLTLYELGFVERHVAANPKVPVFIKVVDPQLEAITQPYYQMLLHIVTRQNVTLIGPYHETGITALACKISGRQIYHWVPYAYDIAREIQLDIKSIEARVSKVLLTGALSPKVYPDRTRLVAARRRSIGCYRRTAHLRHPGYWDIGQEVRHNIVGDRFIQHLSRYVAMWIDGREEGLELLKFCECAYAGCVPFGVAAKTLPIDAAKQIWDIPIGRESKTLKAGLSRAVDELYDSAMRFRSAMRQSRKQDLWIQDVYTQWTADRLRLAAV